MGLHSLYFLMVHSMKDNSKITQPKIKMDYTKANTWNIEEDLPIIHFTGRVKKLDRVIHSKDSIIMDTEKKEFFNGLPKETNLSNMKAHSTLKEDFFKDPYKINLELTKEHLLMVWNMEVDSIDLKMVWDIKDSIETVKKMVKEQSIILIKLLLILEGSEMICLMEEASY